MRRCSRSSAGCNSDCAEACGTGSETWRIVRRAGAAGQQHGQRHRDAAQPVRRCYCCSHGRFARIVQSANSICSGASAAMIGPPRCSIHPRTRMRRPSSVFGSTPAAAKVAPHAPCRMVTVKSRVQRRPKFTYIVAPLSRTDKTLPSTSANWPRSACSPVRFSADKGAKFGSAHSPRPAAAPRVRRSKGRRRRPCRPRAPTPARGLAPAWPAARTAARRR